MVEAMFSIFPSDQDLDKNQLSGNVARQEESWLPGGQHRQEMAMETKQVGCSELEKHAKFFAYIVTR
jgi:hypothetical protein